MTGYGMGEVKYKSGKITFEVKTVNHRFCEVNFRLPNRYYPLESALLEFTKNSFSRGRIDIFIRESGTKKRGKVKVDQEQLGQYLQILKKLRSEIKLSSPPQLENLLSLPQVIVVEDEEEDLQKILELFKKSLKQVFLNVEKVREREGSKLKEAFFEHLKTIEQVVLKTEQKIPEMIQEYQTRLKEKISKLVEQTPDEWKLAQEVAYFVDRTDVSEEIQRLNSHIDHFKEVLKEKGPIGRKLDFVLQEMNREVNTLGSKVQTSSISKSVVICKHELEKMREQVQNVE